jgi:hypothetical protein
VSAWNGGICFARRYYLGMLDDESHKDIDPLPGPTAHDWFAGIMTAAIAGLPTGWAAPAAVLFSLITAPLLGSAREEWWEQVRVELNELHRRVDQLTPEALSKSEVFVAAIAQATQAALRTHEAEKREALKNAVVHVAVNAVAATDTSVAANIPIRSDLEIMFLHMIDSFTATHLQVLKFFANRTPDALERFRRDRELSDQAIVDLLNRGLIADTRPYVERGRDSYDALVVNQWDVTSLGKKFLEFIRPPR